MALRPATLSDVAFIEKLIAQGAADGQFPSEPLNIGPAIAGMPLELDGGLFKQSLWYILEQDDRPVGFVSAARHPDSFKLPSPFNRQDQVWAIVCCGVHPDYRRKGHGRTLVEGLLAEIRSKPFAARAAFIAVCRPAATAMRSLLTKLGFDQRVNRMTANTVHACCPQDRLYLEELAAASRVGQLNGVISTSPEFSAPPLLAVRDMQIKLSKAIGEAWPREQGALLPAAGCCLPLAAILKKPIEAALGCETYATIGWLYSSVTQQPIWKTDTDILVERLTNTLKAPVFGAFDGEFHVWLTTESGEAIDPNVFPALAVRYAQFKNGKTAYAYINRQGLCYRQPANLPVFSYHPQIVLDQHALSTLAPLM